MAVRLISGRDIMEAFAASFTEHQNTNNELEQLKNEIISPKYLSSFLSVYF